MAYVPVPDVLKNLLVTAGIGSFPPTTGWGISIGMTIASPDTLIVIRETGGRASMSGLGIDFPSVQVKVRGAVNGWAAARAKMKDVKNALLNLPSQTIGEDRYTAINAIGDVIDMGQDDNNRPSFVMNFALIVEPSENGYRD